MDVVEPALELRPAADAGQADSQWGDGLRADSLMADSLWADSQRADSQRYRSFNRSTRVRVSDRWPARVAAVMARRYSAIQVWRAEDGQADAGHSLRESGGGTETLDIGIPHGWRLAADSSR